MRKNFGLIVFVLMAGLFAGCGANVAVNNSPNETVIEEPTESSKITLVLPTEVPELADECSACHSDKQRLIDTAAPVVEVEEESEGAG
ncbi:MAG: hypothetical protein ACK2T7_04220 [Anaerolineales bacterium]